MSKVLSVLAVLALITWGALESRAIDVPDGRQFQVEIGSVEFVGTEGGVIVDGELVDVACSLCERGDGTCEMCSICEMHTR